MGKLCLVTCILCPLLLIICSPWASLFSPGGASRSQNNHYLLCLHSPWPSGVICSLEMLPGYLRAPGSFFSTWAVGATVPTCSWVPIILSSMTHPLSSTVGILQDQCRGAGRMAWGLAGWLGGKGACSQADNSSSSLGTQRKARSGF